MRHDAEEWRDIKGYEGIYQVSSIGRVKSLPVHTNAGYGSKKLSPGRMRSLNVGNSGYLFVTLYRNRKSKYALVHRLVAEAFVPNPDNLGYVDHINGDKLDNRAENLRWVTAKENTRYAIEMGLISLEENTKHVTSKKCRERTNQARRSPVIRSDGKRYISVNEAARDLGCSKASISHVLCGRNKTCKGFTFSYA